MREHRNGTDRAPQLRRRPPPGVGRPTSRRPPKTPEPEDVVRAKLAAAEDSRPAKVTWAPAPSSRSTRS
jgi:hypothetical protein